jgi:hypothetical protein
VLVLSPLVCYSIIVPVQTCLLWQVPCKARVNPAERTAIRRQRRCAVKGSARTSCPTYMRIASLSWFSCGLHTSCGDGWACITAHVHTHRIGIATAVLPTKLARLRFTGAIHTCSATCAPTTFTPLQLLLHVNSKTRCMSTGGIPVQGSRCCSLHAPNNQSRRPHAPSQGSTQTPLP